MLRGLFRRVSEPALKWTFWGSATASAILTASIAGTTIGDYAVAEMHGVTEAQTRAKVQQQWPDNPEVWPGMVMEKRRGYNNAIQAHIQVRQYSYAGLALAIPLGAATFIERRRRRQEEPSPSL